METPEPFKITLKNGDEVKVNDHVYCSPSWGVRDGTPYSIARIMEFLPALGTPTVDPKTGRRNEPITRVRLAWYYRPGDVSDRAVADSRLLLAAIYSEVCELAQLRERCFVHHRDRISDLAGWKKRPDRFYFTRLFDPWLRKEFEVIPATTVRNVPAHIRDVLVERYEYIVAEREVVPDLTDDIRLCETCEKWCPPAGSLQCDGCKKYFHMECVTPPMLSKPARGYGWTCAPCARLHEEKVEGHSVQAAKAKTGAPSARGRGRPRKDKSLAEKEENVEIKHFKMWPFRYFGLYTFAEDTLDPDDLIFPRAATRVGPKFQATVPPTTGTDDRPKDVEERGGDATIEVLSLVNEMDEQDAANYEKQKDMLTRSETLKRSVDWLTEVTFRLTDAWLKQRDFATVSMRSPMRLQKFNRSETRYTEKDWAPDEVAAFEDAIQMHGAELRAVREEVSTRTMPEVVRFYGHWKSAKVGEENARIRAARAAGLDVKSSSPAREASPEEEEGSVIVEMRRGHPSCGACRTRESALWWKAPKGLATTILCESCGPSWRKYADLNVRPVREEAPVKVAKAENKREGTPLAGPSTKRAKTVSSQHSTPPPPPPPSVPQLRCVACQKNGPEGKVLRCKQCQFRVHASACGFPPASTASDAWMCDLCENEQSPEASLISDCMLCPRMWRDPKKKLIYPPPDTFLRACKPTEGQAWVHVLCSVFVPEITYSDAAKLKLVEGISAILEHRWQHKCSLCDRDDGAVVQCSECPAEFHVSCAWKQGHKFGFEMQQAKGRRETMPVVEFKGASGVLVPTIICKGHTGHKRVLVDLCEPADASGAAESALQLYCRAYKQAPVSETHALLRKAMRLDRILEEQMARLRDLRGRLYNAQQHPQSQQPQQNANGVGPIVVDVPIVDADPPEPEPHCYRCRTQFSPLWHELAGAPPATNGVNGHGAGAATAATATNGAGRAWMCHKCHASNRQAFPVMIGIATS
ncbi:uncharacterized protein BXZ73DRAFT_95950 [Epithele typhae]|uniref:uncharacterized protein n=1 Tax=Epithele typhae TaxID=378194 RepID=UPI00200745F7|nr:uncharacterized protein BXZ73DRAFT_95950 [Epithele typhae]KAH9944958.1 hypothetical protein BXZ73DRAFT_95950 [Epithele typhae]